MAKKVVTVLILLSSLFLISGYFFVEKYPVIKNKYFEFTAIVGTIISVVSIYSFVSSNKAIIDIENTDNESLKKISKAITELEKQRKDIENASSVITQKQREINELEIQKKEIEVLIQKGSLLYFLKDQLKIKTDRIIQIIENNPELNKLISDKNDIENKLILLEEEVSKNPHVEILNSIISETPISNKLVEKRNYSKLIDNSFIEKVKKFIMGNVT
jgi:hypothetical protein